MPEHATGGNEVRVTSATGGQKGQKMLRLGGADPIAMMELGMVYGMGELKYDRYNYLKGYDWSLSIDALLRHLLKFESGEDYDECSAHPGQHDDDHEYDPAVCDGSGLPHTAHVAWHGLTLTSFLLRGVGNDDRPKSAPKDGLLKLAWDKVFGQKHSLSQDETEFYLAERHNVTLTHDTSPCHYKRPDGSYCLQYWNHPVHFQPHTAKQARAHHPYVPSDR